MKRDDFGMRIDEIRELATKYSKPDLARMVKMGMIEPQKALMAGMMIDRIAKSAMEPPQTTVVEDVLNPEQPTTAQAQVPQGVMGAPGAPPPSAGVAGLPSGIQNMAGGGIVAFADGDLVSASDTMRRGLASQPAPMATEPSMPTLPGGLRFKEYEPMAAPSLESEFDTSRRAEQMAGVDTAALFSKLREEEVGRREELKGRREQAKGEALLMAGLGLMGARRGQEFEVLSNVGRQAVMQYGSALKEIRDTERDIKKSERELMLAEDKYKRDQSAANANRLAQKQEKYEDRKIRSVDQYNKAVEEVTKLNMEVFKLERKEASDMAIAQVQSKTSRDVAEIHERGAMARVGALGAEERIINNMLADLRKTNPNATYLDAVQAVKAGSRTGTVTDKELQDAYEARLKEIIGKKARDEFLTKYPTWREFAAEQRGQAGAAPTSSGQVDTSNPLLR